MEKNAVLSPVAKKDCCPWCMKPIQIIWVHGHGQCGHCGINIQPCCDGLCSNEFNETKMEAAANKDKD